VALILIVLAFGFGIVALAGDWLVLPTGSQTDYSLTQSPGSYYGGQCLQFRLLVLCNNCVPIKMQDSCTTYRHMNKDAIAAGAPANDADDDDDNDDRKGFSGPYKRHLAAGATAFALIIVGELIGFIALAHAIMLAAERPYNWLAGRHHRATWVPTLAMCIFVFWGWLIYTCVIFTDHETGASWDVLQAQGAKISFGYCCAIVSWVLALIAAIIIMTCHRDIVVVTTTTAVIPPHEHHYGAKKGIVMEERRASMAA
jgi:hypothetical protein